MRCALRKQIRHVLVRHLGKFFQRLRGLLELVRELGVLLVLPRFAQRREARLQRSHAVLQVAVETLQLLGKAPHLLGIHHGLRHKIPFALCAKGAGNRRQVQIENHRRRECSGGVTRERPAPPEPPATSVSH